MEGNQCDINLLDADVLLPPRKRLLAGLKKQNSDVSSHVPISFSNDPESDFDARLNSLLRSHLEEPNRTNEEIVEASRLAAIEAAKFAAAARAVAEEKAAIAAKAVAAAKSALQWVATVEEAASKERYLKKNRMKKHVPVETLYGQQKRKLNNGTDEEVARNLHRAINSSPRILKNAPNSDMKNQKHKRLKSSSSSEKTKGNNITICEGDQSTMSSGKGTGRKLDPEGAGREVNMVRVDLKTLKFHKTDCAKAENGEEPQLSKIDTPNSETGEGEMTNSKEKTGESLEDGIGKKKGKMKQKKLPLSICNFRDRENIKEELKPKSLSLTQEDVNKAAAGDKLLLSVGSSGDNLLPVDRSTTWKCQAFKAPASVKQNKVMQS